MTAPRTGQVVNDDVPESESSGILDAIKQRLLYRSWYVHPPVALIVQASPIVCLNTMALAAKPSTERLHLRNLFAHGRRYHFLDGSQDGFRLATTSRVIWRFRGVPTLVPRGRRSSTSAVMQGAFEALNPDTTRIHLQTHIRLSFLLETFLIPLFFTTIVLFMPWLLSAKVVLLGALFGLSWIGHRNAAAIEAHDMVFFVEKALEDFVNYSIPELDAAVPHVIDQQQRDFEAAWEQFYAAHKDD